MALRLRRGTDSERQLITPVDGELIYTTDTKLLYVGDGTTVGGTLVTGAGGAGSATLDGLTDTDIVDPSNGDVLSWNAGTNKWEASAVAGIGIISLNNLSDVFLPETPAVGDILRFDGLNFTAQGADSIFEEQQNYKINIVGDDSTILVDTDTNTFTGNFFGSVIGDVSGSVFADNSSLIVDAINGNIYANSITTNSIEGSFGYMNIQSIDAVNNLVFRRYQPLPGNHSEIYSLTDGTTGSSENIFVSRGALNAAATLQLGDIIYSDNIVGHTGAGYQLSSSITHFVDPGGTISGITLPGLIALSTFTDGNPANFKGLVIDSRGFVGINKGANPSQATLDINGFAKLAILTAAPSTLVNGLIAIADGTSWNPTSSGIQTVVAYINNGWVALS